MPAVTLTLRFLLSLVAALTCSAAVVGQDDLPSAEEQAIQSAVQRVAPSVVRIETIGGAEVVGKTLVGTAPTTGLVVGADGYIVSSAYNFIQQPSSILVVLPDGKRAAAKIVARDHSRMLVLLKVSTDVPLAMPELAPREEVRIGQWSIAVGRTFDGSEPAVSVGVVSALNRIWNKAVQTDAKISPNNYGGPLIDIQGRVIGVLTPLSPQAADEVAGAEWYDSGIGFAIPLADILAQLPTLMEGKDLHAGLIGVSLKAGDMYALPAEVAVSPPNSPAALAGIKPGDIIIKVAGVNVASEAQLKHAIGPHYAGETIELVVKRKDVEFATRLELAEKLEPYAHPFLGILPMRDPPVERPAVAAADVEKAGIVVRYVFPGSPAAEAGVQPGDRLLSINDKTADSASGFQEVVAGVDPKQAASLQLYRGDAALKISVKTSKLPTSLPAELPSALSQPLPTTDPPQTTGLVELKLPEEKTACWAVVPAEYHPRVSHGLVVWLHSADGIDKSRFEARWQTLANKHQFVVLAPSSADGKKWDATEADLVGKVIDDAIGRYNIDRSRIVVFGEEGGGTMAWLVGLQQTERVRGIAVVDAVPPPRVKMPENDPVRRLAFLLGEASKSRLTPQLEKIGERLSEQNFPVTTKKLGDQARALDESKLAELALWIDQLDRI